MNAVDPDREGAPDFGLEAQSQIRRPRRFKVLLHNDDYTSMEFVVRILIEHFRKPPAEATHVMLQVHHKGVGVAGIYPRDIAETKIDEVTQLARAEGMPLRLTSEAVDSDGDAS